MTCFFIVKNIVTTTLKQEMLKLMRLLACFGIKHYRFVEQVCGTHEFVRAEWCGNTFLILRQTVQYESADLYSVCEEPTNSGLTVNPLTVSSCQ